MDGGGSRFRLTTPVTPEDDLHYSVYCALRVLLPPQAVIHTHEARNAASAVEGARRKRLGQQAGWPDMSVWYRGRVALLELKTEVGRLSTAQKLLHPRLAWNGFPIAVCRSVEAALDAVRAAGIPVRGRATA